MVFIFSNIPDLPYPIPTGFLMIQIMIFLMDVKVMISPSQMVCQETHSTSRSSGLHPSEAFHLQICEGTATAFQKSFIHLKQMKVTGHFGNITAHPLLPCLRQNGWNHQNHSEKVLHYCGPDRLTDSLMCSIVDHDIIQLCVIVRYTEGQLTCIQ